LPKSRAERIVQKALLLAFPAGQRTKPCYIHVFAGIKTCWSLHKIIIISKNILSQEKIKLYGAEIEQIIKEHRKKRVLPLQTNKSFWKMLETEQGRFGRVPRCYFPSNVNSQNLIL